MDAVKYLETVKKMCKRYPHCAKCPLLTGLKCLAHPNNDGPIEEVVSIVETWAAEHPAKTYKQDFLEKFPDAIMQKAGYPVVCKENVYGNPISKCGNDEHTCEICWNEEMK